MRRVTQLVNSILAIGGVELRRRLPPSVLYVSAAETVLAAKDAGVSVCDYVESLWDEKGGTSYVIKQMRDAGCFMGCKTVCEIGPGTARFLEKTLNEIQCERYEFYELADDWASWIATTYGSNVIRQPTNGSTLVATSSDSCDLVTSHGVFAYIPMLSVLEYINECVRVTRIGGYIVFDCFTEQEFPPEIVNAWISDSARYPVIIPTAVLFNYCERLGLSLVSEFRVKFGAGMTRYFIFRKSETMKFIAEAVGLGGPAECIKDA
jgi:phospholipid N-methyltransferase